MLRRVELFLIILMLIFLAAFIYKAVPSNTNILKSEIDYKNLKVKVADDYIWSNKNFNDLNWSNWDPSLVEDWEGKIWWLRTDIPIEEELEPNKKYGIKIVTSGPHEVYFDGKLIGHNGSVDLKSGLESIKYQKLYFIPDHLAIKGNHKVAIRIWSPENITNFRIFFGDYLNLSRDSLILSVFIHVLAGILLTIAIAFSILIFWSTIKWDIIILIIFSIIGLSLLMIEYVKFYYDYSYQFQMVRLMIIGFLTLILSCLIPIFLVYYYQLTKYIKVVYIICPTILLGVFAFVPGYDFRAQVMISVSLAISAFLTLIALQKRKKGLFWVNIGLTLCAFSLVYYYDIILFIGLTTLIVAIAVAEFAIYRDEKRRHQKALLTAKRMEIELLKKKIQPHFLINTLTSLIDIIEENPRVAVTFIYSLSGLFEIINEISSESSIPINKEIALCKAHLKIMGYRQDMKYKLTTHNIDTSERIPPAILLTIIENGLLHNKPVNEEMVFDITFERTSKQISYTIKSSGKPRIHMLNIQDGIGNQYIKARIQEYWNKGTWDFISKKGENGWFTRIEFHS